jgi:GNAT superfamily N-acetyltransferase
MHIIQVAPDERRLINQFLDLPFHIYQDIPQWVPPLRMDVRRVFDRRRFPFYNHSEAAFFLAIGDGREPLGRIAVLDNHNFNRHKGEKTAFFYLFESIEDEAVATKLFQAAFAWAHSRGLDSIMGPKGFTPLDGLGLLVKGFEHRAVYGVPYNPEYYRRLIEGLDFGVQRDMLSGFVDRDTKFPPAIHRVADRVKERRGLHIARLETRGQLRRIIPKLKEMYNKILASVPNNMPLTDDEIDALANQIIWFANPKMIKIVMKGDEAVGFVLAYPDISAALQRTGGKLFPLGWIDILLELRRTREAILNGIGILEEYRGTGGTVILFSELAKTLTESRYQRGDLVQVGTDNDKMLRELEKLGVDFYKMHRIYRRSLI